MVKKLDTDYMVDKNEGINQQSIEWKSVEKRGERAWNNRGLFSFFCHDPAKVAAA